MTEKIKKETKAKSKRLILPEETIQTFVGSRYIQPYSLFYLVNKEYPSKINFTNIDKEVLLEKLFKTFEISEKEIIISKTFDFDSGKYRFNSVVIPIKKDLFVFFNPGHDDTPGVEILFTSTTPMSAVSF